MNSFFYLERELLGAIRARSGSWFGVGLVFLFLFLATFASLFVLPEAQGEPAPGLVIAYLSPRVSSAEINDLSDRLRERSDVLRVRFSLPRELTAERTGGQLELTPRSVAEVPTLVRALAAMEQVQDVEALAAEPLPRLAMTPALQTGLLVGLGVCALASLAAVREAFRALLATFRQELRLARLAGVSERLLMGVVGLAGLLWGTVAGLLVVVALLFYDASGPSLEAWRLFGVMAVSLLLGILMGGLAGLVGASQLSSKLFEPLR
ncbi:MAG: hypothetical protein AB1778_00015 [Candidatus Bipolaricaulota bacterium]